MRNYFSITVFFFFNVNEVNYSFWSLVEFNYDRLLHIFVFTRLVENWRAPHLILIPFRCRGRINDFRITSSITSVQTLKRLNQTHELTFIWNPSRLYSLRLDNNARFLLALALNLAKIFASILNGSDRLLE